MNILYITADRGIPVLGHKGASVHIRSLVEAFVRLGHSVTIATPRVGKGERVSAEMLPISLPTPRRDLPNDRAKEQQTRDYSDVLTTVLLPQIDQFDLIYERYSLWSDAGARLAEATGLPFVLEVNAPLREEAIRYRDLFDTAAARQIEQTQFSRADEIAVVSEALREYVVAHGGTQGKSLILPNAVDPQQFHPAVRGGKVRDRYNLHGKRVIGFVGRVRPWHDIDTLLTAVAQLQRDDPRYHLLLVGQTDEAVAAQVAELGLTATLTGAIPHTDIPQHIAAMDVAVSSHINAEDFYFSPLKLYEYLACGAPTVAANIGQPAQLITNGVNGWLYQPEDSADLAQKITTVFADPAHTRAVAWQGASEILQTYTWDHNAAAVVDLVSRDSIFQKNGMSQNGGLPILDDKLRQRLYRATRDDLALPLLKKSVDWGSFRPKQITAIHLLKYKPSRRCVLQYHLKGRDRKTGERHKLTLVGKVFRDERGAKLHALQSALSETDFAPDAQDRITVPTALGYVEKMRMQVQGWSNGQTLEEIAPHHDITPLMPRTAEAIAKLHDWRVPTEVTHLLRQHPLTKELALIAEFAERLTAYASVTHWLTALQQWASHLPQPRQATPVHRDFYYSQLLFDGDDVTLIDFDLLAWGDPAIDIANFTAHLTLLGLTLHADAQHYAHARRDFCAAYLTEDATFWQRHAFYEAATYFRLLYIVASRPHWAHHFDSIADRLDQLIIDHSSSTVRHSNVL